ncbi:MAG: cupin domain-containing protein [Candidatus Izemoplasmatales bacterium]|jgi:mannose-6-phosphate isomerase-like protein (cupin superfamily)
MKIVKKDQRKEFKNSDCCLAYEYPMDDSDINGAAIKLSGRYPDKGWAVNEICKEMGYIISGSGKLVVEDKEYELTAGDLVLINPGEKFYWQGNMEIFMPCAPAWSPDQYKTVK